MPAWKGQLFASVNDTSLLLRYEAAHITIAFPFAILDNMDYILESLDALGLSNIFVVLGLTAAVLLTACRTFQNRKRGTPQLPPGPPPEPLLGHYRSVPEDAAFKQYDEWAKEYSTAL
jgi:hypothetical protein